MKEHLAELRQQRLWKLDALSLALKSSINKGYEFGGPNTNLFIQLVQLEAQIRELSTLENEK